MIRIGDFSKLSRVSVKTLRYYDEMGLLKPLHVDRFTGYRSLQGELSARPGTLQQRGSQAAPRGWPKAPMNGFGMEENAQDTEQDEGINTRGKDSFLTHGYAPLTSRIRDGPQSETRS